MRIFSPKRYLRKLPIAQKFYIIIAVVAAILIFEFAGFWFAMGTTSAIRAYVQGEDLWSKSQKESLLSLLKYSNTFDEAHYQDFLSNQRIPQGDMQARLELLKPSPNLAVARQGFLDGGNNPADIDGMIFLFRHFRQVSYLSKAINLWTEGDAHIATQQAIGAQMHEIISRDPGSQATVLAVRQLKMEAWINNTELTPLETQFSATLGEAARNIGLALLIAIAALTSLLAAAALAIALLMSRIMTRVDAAKTEFVALTSHQLRSPLNVISLSVDLLKVLGPPRSVEEKNAVEGIAREVSQMAALIDAILNVSRIELGTLVIEPKPLDIMAFARAAAEPMRMLAESRGLTLLESCEPDELVLPMDATLLQIVLQNLLSNAIKYTPPGGEVRLSVKRLPLRVLISVADTGDGIPEAQQEQIFKKLFRTERAAKTDPHGSGLGLYIVRSIVRESGGSVWFESEDGNGATFYVSFPLSGMRASRGNIKL